MSSSVISSFEEPTTTMRKPSLNRKFTDVIQCVHNPTYDVLELKTHYGSKSTIAQLLVTIAQSLMLVNVGMELAMSTVVIGSFYKSKAVFSLSDSQSSWYGSILFICQPIGSLLSGYVQKHYGKRTCTYFSCIPSIVGWLLLWSANSVTMLYVSSITMGLGLSFNDGPVYSYIGEVCEPRLRGIMCSLVNMACLMGMMGIYGLAFVCHWRTVALMSMVCPILCLILSVFIPESPIWLLSKGKNKKAMESICWLRGWVDPCVVAREYQELLFYYEKSIDQANKSCVGKLSMLTWLRNPSVYRPLRLASIYYVFTLVSCLTPCRPYIVKIMNDSGVKDQNSKALVLFGVMQLCGSMALTFTIRKFGKRMLTLGSLTVNTFALLLYGIYITCIQNDLITARSCIPMTLFSIIMFSGAMGMLTIPWTLVSEIYPNEFKGIASSLTIAIYYTLTFVTTKMFLDIEETLGLKYTILTFSGLSFFGFIYLHKSMPETEGQTLLEIEEFFVPKSKSKFNKITNALILNDLYLKKVYIKSFV